MTPAAYVTSTWQECKKKIPVENILFLYKSCWVSTWKKFAEFGLDSFWKCLCKLVHCWDFLFFIWFKVKFPTRRRLYQDVAVVSHHTRKSEKFADFSLFFYFHPQPSQNFGRLGEISHLSCINKISGWKQNF